MGDTQTYRFRRFTIMADPMGVPTYQARCVSGEEHECGEQSEAGFTVAEREQWIQDHFLRTRHARYLHTVSDYRVVLPGEWL
jgi:hypothetical protein